MKIRTNLPYPWLSEKKIIARIKKYEENKLNTTKENKDKAMKWLQTWC